MCSGHREKSCNFKKSLFEISKFPQESFDDYAKQLKLLDEKGYKMGSINTNNLLVDYDKKQIHIIDSFKKASPLHINTRYVLTSTLLDFSLYEKFYEKLEASEKDELVNSAEIIKTKCKKAANKFNIKEDETAYINYLSNVDKYFGFYLLDKGGDYRSRYYSMKNILMK